MRRTSVCVLMLIATMLILAPAARSQDGPGGVQASSEASYAIGYDLGEYIAQRLRDDGVEANADDLLQGVSDALKASPARIPPAQMREVLRELSDSVETRRASSQLASDPVYRALAEDNLRRSQRFHAMFGAQASVQSLESGVQYLVVAEGEGAPPEVGDTVIVSFECKLISGVEVMDQDRTELDVGGAIPGGREALTRMRPGARWTIAIPPDMAFGDVGSPPIIGPNETLIIDVELHSIKAGE